MNQRIRFFIEDWARCQNVSQIHYFVDVLIRKIIPVFDDVDEEARLAAQKFLESEGNENFDQATAYEGAHGASLAQGIAYLELRTAYVALGVSGLFHLFERQLLGYMHHHLDENINNFASTKRLLANFIYAAHDGEEKRLDLSDAIQARDLLELSYLANAAKHGPGNSYDSLRAMNAVVVSDERLKSEWTADLESFVGVEVSIGSDDILRYQNALVEFWALDGEFWADSA